MKNSDYSEAEIKDSWERWILLESDIARCLSPEGELLCDDFEAERVLIFSLSKSAEIIFGDK